MRPYFACWLFAFLFNSTYTPAQQDKKLVSLISVYTKAESDTDRINKYANIGAYLINKGNFTQAITYFQKIITTFSKTYPKKGIDAQNKIAFIYISLEEYAKADSVVNEMLAQSTKLDYEKG